MFGLGLGGLWSPCLAGNRRCASDVDDDRSEAIQSVGSRAAWLERQLLARPTTSPCTPLRGPRARPCMNVGVVGRAPRFQLLHTIGAVWRGMEMDGICLAVAGRLGEEEEA